MLTRGGSFSLKSVSISTTIHEALFQLRKFVVLPLKNPCFRVLSLFRGYYSLHFGCSSAALRSSMVPFLHRSGSKDLEQIAEIISP